jgi:hypothetical protein
VSYIWGGWLRENFNEKDLAAVKMKAGIDTWEWAIVWVIDDEQLGGSRVEAGLKHRNPS